MNVTVNLSEYLRETARATPHRTALVEQRAERRELTWREFDSAADAVARALSGRGLVAGQRVAIVMSNRIALPVSYFGVLRGGMVAVPINVRAASGEIARMLRDCGALLVLCDEAGITHVREAIADIADAPMIVVKGTEKLPGEMTFEDFLAAASGDQPVAPQDDEALAVVLYTSGTSGHPRGAMLTHRSLIANIEQTAAIGAMLPEDYCLGLLPLFHIYGLNCVLGQVVRQGATLRLVDGFDPDGLLDIVAEEGVTNLPLAPPVFAAWTGREGVREKLADVRLILSGASALDPELAEEFHASTGKVIEQGYGLTETSPVIATTLGAGRRGDGLPKPGSVGRALPGIEVRIVETSGIDANPADPAEVWVRGDNVFSGYWPDGSDGPRPDGWYPTGDIGFLDADGDLFLVDRLRELVIVSGFNVYPVEVEEVIGELDIIRQVAVVGVPDAETGEAVAAIMVARESAAELPDGELIARVEEHCASELARFKQPTQFAVVKGLPVSATGKIAKGRLRSMARSGLLGLDTL